LAGGWPLLKDDYLDKKLIERLRVPSGKKVKLDDYETGWAQNEEMKKAGKEALKEDAKKLLEKNIRDLAKAQELLWASDTYSLLIVLQGMDAAGKDGTIKHVMSGINPQGCRVVSFGPPSHEELAHDFLWRVAKVLPERGHIGIFNRSHYEEVLAVRVHPELLRAEELPPDTIGDGIWEDRYRDINNFEQHLVRNGTVVLKFFLHISREEQKSRFLERLEDQNKQWKFTASDIAERAYWDDYRKAYQEAIGATSTSWAPWHIIPADYKWAARTLVAEIITSRIQSLSLEYPKPTKEEREMLEKAKKKLEMD
jgi:PPK2 family polyphosphate:nucleotide phosphotransferase